MTGENESAARGRRPAPQRAAVGEADLFRVLAGASALITGDESDRDEIARSITELARRVFGGSFDVRWRERSDVAQRHPEQLREGAVALPVLIGGNEVASLVCRPAVEVTADVEASMRALADILAGAVASRDLHEVLDANDLFERSFDEAQVGMQMLTPDGEFLRVNRAFADFVGYRPEELIGRSWRDVSLPEEMVISDGVRRRLWSRDLPSFHQIKRYRTKQGEIVWGSLTVTPVFREPWDDAPAVVVAHVVDISTEMRAIEELTEAKRDLLLSDQRHRALIGPRPDAVLRLAEWGGIIDANGAAQRMFDFVLDDLVAIESDHPHMRTVLPSEIADTLETLADGALADSTPRSLEKMWVSTRHVEGWFNVTVLREWRQVENGVHVEFSDITTLVENEQRLSASALADGLTGVANRAAIVDRLEHALTRLHRHDEVGVAVAAIDIDHFKRVNDTYGNAFGDEALQQFAHQVRDVLRVNDSLGRLGGDEFMIVLEDLASLEDAHVVARRLAAAMNPIVVEIDDGRAVELHTSIGIAWTPETVRAEELMSRADRALLDAKRNGRGRLWTEIHDESIRSGAPVDRYRLRRDLAAALANRELRVRYQPILDGDRRVTAVEALLRWQHPTRGLLEPADFLELLVQSGQIGPVGGWVLDSAVEQLAEWDTQGLDGLCLHVNVSATELAQEGFRASLHTALRRHRIDPRRLTIEVGEAALQHSAVASSALADIAELGVRLVLDGFGNGASSIAHLRHEALRGIKIDRSFVSGGPARRRDRAIVEGIVSMARELGLAVTVSGIENVEQERWVRATGCDEVQGWLFSKAVAPVDIVPLVRQDVFRRS